MGGKSARCESSSVSQNWMAITVACENLGVPSSASALSADARPRRSSRLQKPGSRLALCHSRHVRAIAERSRAEVRCSLMHWSARMIVVPPAAASAPPAACSPDCASAIAEVPFFEKGRTPLLKSAIQIRARPVEKERSAKG